AVRTFCEGGVDNRQGAGEDKGTAQALNRARREQDFGPRSKATGKRGKGVQCEARDEYATSPEQVGCATAEQKEAARRHRVRADYGLQRVGGVAQVAPDLGKRYDDDVLVERDEDPPPISTAPDIRPSNFARAGFINHARLRPEATAHSASEKAASSAETKHMTASCGTTGRYGSMNCGRNA